MKLTFAAAALALGLATGAPLEAKRQAETTTATNLVATATSSGLFSIETISVSSIPAPSSSSIAFGTGVSVPFPSGTGAPFPTGAFPTGVFPTGTAFPLPSGTGLAGNPYASLPTCSENGALVCNGETEFGICNWGHVLFVPVAAGTRCVDGKIV